MSDSVHSFRKISLASGFVISRVMLFFPALRYRCGALVSMFGLLLKNGPKDLHTSPISGISTLITSAPRSLNTLVQ